MRRRFGVLLMSAVLIAGCGPDAGGRDAAEPPAPTPTEISRTSTENSPTPTENSRTQAEKSTTEVQVSGVVVLDPGHNGGNAGAQAKIGKQVPAGRGRTKPCNTTGTATADGYPEHEFTFDVARRVQRLLEARGITVVLTRTTDDGVGPCVNRRAAIGNENRADAVVSIHADGHTDTSARGFHIAYSAPPLNDAQGEPAMRLARALRDGLQDAGFPLSTYLGSDGLSPRNDLAGLNLSERPAALVECGNMHNPDEAAAMATPTGRQSYAQAIADGIRSYLS